MKQADTNYYTYTSSLAPAAELHHPARTLMSSQEPARNLPSVCGAVSFKSRL